MVKVCISGYVHPTVEVPASTVQVVVVVGFKTALAVVIDVGVHE